MIDPRENPHWYRVAGLQARLRDQVQIHRHTYRGARWFILQDRGSTRHFRCTDALYQLIRLMDGERTVDEIWRAVNVQLGERAPGQDDVIKMLSTLHSSDLLICPVTPDSAALLVRHERARGGRWKQYVPSPLLVRIPLLDPDAWLERLRWLAHGLFNPLAVVAWVLLVALAAILVGLYWPEVMRYGSERAFTSYNSLLLFAIYPVVKGIHELAHGLAIKRWGAEVHEAGVMLLLLMPIPYVDASASASFGDKRRRMLVGAAGIGAELFLAALATLAWFNVETGIVRDVAFNVMLIGSVSTVLFNGNPLLRFDGYYVLADAIEIPNLASRSTLYYGYLAQRLLGVEAPRNPATAPGEASWFAVYGLAAYAYRMFILVMVVLLVAESFLLAGTVLALFFLTTQLLRPAWKHLRFLLTAPALRGHRARALACACGVAAAALAAIFVVPIGSSSYSEGVIWLSDDAEVRAGADGFVVNAIAESNAHVARDEALVQIDDPLLTLRVENLIWDLRELKARYDAEFVSDRVGASILREELVRLKQDLTDARAELRKLTVQSPADGVFLLADANDLQGRFVKKGDLLGYVTDLSQPTIKTVARQADVARIRRHTRSINVRLADTAGETYHAQLAGGAPAATHRLPSPALGTLGGGAIPVEPDDKQGLKSIEQVFVFDLTLPPEARVRRIGARTHIRFEHARETLAAQWSRSLRQLFLRRLAV